MKILTIFFQCALLVSWINGIYTQTACASAIVERISVTPMITGEVSTDRVNNIDSIRTALDNSQSTEILNCQTCNYFTASVVDNTLVIVTGTDYELYEENESFNEVTYTLGLTCVGTGSPNLIVVFEFENVNNHDPAFDQNQYSFDIPLPLFSGFSLDLVGFQISARDIDIYNTQVTFSSTDSVYFDIGTSSLVGDEGKRFYATITSKNQILEFRSDVQFTITATDSGNPARSADVIVVITGDPAIVFVDSPEFESNIYTGRLSNVNVLDFTEVISVTAETLSEDITITTTGVDQIYFLVNTLAPNQYSIQLSPDFTNAAKENRAFFQLEMSATTSNLQSGNTIIIIEIEPDVEIVLEFEQVLYTGDFKLPNVLTIGTIKLTDASYSDEVVFTLEGDDKNFFEISNAGNSVVLNLANDLEESEILGKQIFELTIQAAIGTITGYTALVITIEQEECIEVTEVLLFEHPLYTHSFSWANGLSVPQVILSPASYQTDVIFELEGVDMDFFTMTNDENVITIYLKSDVTEDVIPDQTSFQFSIKASRSGAEGFVAVVIMIEPDECLAVPNVLRFEKSLYTGQLSLLNVLQLESLKLTEEYTESIQYALEGLDRDFFSYDSNDNTLTIVDPIPEDSLVGKSVFELTIKASKDNGVDAFAGIVIVIEGETPVSTVNILFEKSLYTGEYLLTTESIVVETIKLTLPINIGDVEITLDGVDKDLFVFALNEAENGIDLSLIPTITPEQLADKQHFELTIKASKPTDDATIDGFTAVVIMIESEECTEESLLSFEESLYTGSITLPNNPTIASVIKLTDATFSSDVILSLEGVDVEFFTGVQTDNSFVITLTNPITNTDLADGKIFFELLVKASKTGSTDAFTSVIIGIEIDECVTNPDLMVFEANIYSGTIVLPNEPVIVGTIKLTDATFTADVVLSLEGADLELFDGVQTGNSLVVTLKNPITNADLAEGKTFFELLVRASKAGSTNVFAAVIIAIDDSECVTNPSDLLIFEESLYSGSILLPNEPVIVGTIKLTDATFTSDVVLSLEGADLEFFDGAQTANSFVITLKNPITNADLADGKTFFELLVKATKTGFTDVYTAVIIGIEIDECVTNPDLMVFEANIYSGTIILPNEPVIVGSIKLTDATYTADVVLSLEGADLELFDGVQTGNSLVVTLKNPITNADLAEGKTFFELLVRASKAGSTNVFAAVIIAIDDSECVTNPSDLMIFEENLYSGSILLPNEPVIVGTIKLTDATFTSDVVLSLEGVDLELFNGVQTANTFVITLKNPITNDDLTVGKIFFELLVKATKTGSTDVYTAVIIGIEDSDCATSPDIMIFEENIFSGTILLPNNPVFDQVIKLTEATYSADVVFSLEGNDVSYFTATKVDNSYVITLGTPIVNGDLEPGKNHFELIVKATKSGSDDAFAVVIIAIEDLECATDILIFEEIIYSGTIDLPNNPEFPQVIKLTDATYSEDVIITLEGNDVAYFDGVQTGNSLVISLKDPLTIEEVVGKLYFDLSVKATKSGYFNGNAAVFIEITNGECISETNMLIFEENIYTGTFTLPDVLNIPSAIKLTDATYSDGVVFTLEGIDEELFDGSQEGNLYTITLKNPIIEDLVTKSFFELSIKATKSGSFNAYTALIIGIETTECIPETDALVFEENLYSGTFKLPDIFTFTSIIKLTEATYSSGVVLTINGIDANYFTGVQTENLLTISLTNALTVEDLNGKKYFEFNAVATKDGMISGNAAIIVVVEDDECSGETKTISFENTLYSGSISAAGALTMETLKLVEIVADVSFVIEQDIPSLFSVNWANDELTVTLSRIPTDADKEGRTVFTLVITGNSASWNSGSTVVIITLPTTACQEGNTAVDKSLIVLTLKEEEVHTDIIDSVIENCEYTIENVTPDLGTDIFSIDEVTHKLVSTIFDRENPIFTAVLVPQFQITLRLACTETSDTISRSKRELGYVYTDDIINEWSLTMLNVIIEDINDNAPIFILPTESRTVLGYPEPEVAEKILPPYLTIVQATDADEGNFAKISYSIEANSHFGINSETGLVYPSSTALSSVDEVSLIVHAIDEDGAGPHDTEITLVVKKLSANHLALMTVENQLLENTASILNHIETTVGLKVKMLNSALVSIEDSNSRMWKQTTQSTMLRMIIYSFDSDEIPMEATAISEALTGLDNTYVITTADLTEATSWVGTPLEQDDTVFIVVICILGVIIVIISVIAFIGWWFWIRPYDLPTRKDSTSSQNNFVDSSSIVAFSNPTNGDIGKDKNELGVSNLSFENESANNIGVVNASNDRYARSLESMLEEDRKIEITPAGSPTGPNSPAERKKSIVTFNEMVERIDFSKENEA